eukprot:GHVS01065162.1.p2 GENE.GHVS01065162.1~~GHVS01065162.1.p2  ORF type:complete len:101 (-),score=22.26 GHVS01065162.1:141-443(-)
MTKPTETTTTIPDVTTASPADSRSSCMGDMFSWNCREELDGHVACVKLYLHQHVKYGTPYNPGGGADDHCTTTRSLYMRCMQYRKRHPSPSASVAFNHPV